MIQYILVCYFLDSSSMYTRRADGSKIPVLRRRPTRVLMLLNAFMNDPREGSSATAFIYLATDSLQVVGVHRIGLVSCKLLVRSMMSRKEQALRERSSYHELFCERSRVLRAYAIQTVWRNDMKYMWKHKKLRIIGRSSILEVEERGAAMRARCPLNRLICIILLQRNLCDSSFEF